MTAPIAKPIGTRCTETSVSDPEVPSSTSCFAGRQDLQRAGDLLLGDQAAK